MDPFLLLSRLAGRWSGRGVGSYPTIPSFTYREEASFLLAPEYPLLRFEQRAWLEPDEKPSHWELGLWLITPSGDIQLSTAQDSGRVEVLSGQAQALGDDRIHLVLRSKYLGNDARLVSTERVITVEGDRLHYEKLMATTTTPTPLHQRHLKATLQRVGQ